MKPLTLPLKHPSLALSLTLFLAFLLLYGSMSAPGLDWGDAGEMQLAAWTAGLSHPTGYPLMIMLGWLWTHLLALFGVEPTRGMTLFSVTAGAATVAAMVPMMLALFRRGKLELSPPWSHFLAASAALFFGFSYTFWAQALRAEVYTLNALFLVLLLWGLWAGGARGRGGEGAREREGDGSMGRGGASSASGRRGLWYRGRRLLSFRRFAHSPTRPYLESYVGLALFYGIALSHHRTMILWAAGLLLWLWLEYREQFTRRRLFRLMTLIALPQLVYLYVAWRGPLTAYLHQPLADGQIFNLYDGSLSAFLDHVLGTVFAAELGLQQTLWERLAGVWELAKLNTGEMSWVGLPFILYSLAGWAGREKRPNGKSNTHLSDRLLLLSGGLATLLFGIFYAIGDVEVMFIPFWLVLIILMFTGIGIVISQLNQVEKNWRPMTVNLIIPLLIGGSLITQVLASPSSRANLESPRRLVNELMTANPPSNGILVTNDRNEMVPFWYAQFAEGQRDDLLALFPLITTQPEHAHVNELVEWALQWGRPVFLTKPMPGLALRYELEPYAGSLVRVQGLATIPTQPVLQSDLAPELSLVGWDASPPKHVLRDEVLGGTEGGRGLAGESVTLSLALQPTQPITHALSFSLQLFSTDGTPITQKDIGPDPFYPSSDWAVGEPLRLQIAFTIPAEVAAGTYEWRLSSYVLQPEGFLPIGQQVVIGQFYIN